MTAVDEDKLQQLIDSIDLPDLVARTASGRHYA